MIQMKNPNRTTLDLNELCTTLCTIMRSDVTRNQFKILLIRCLQNSGESGIRTRGTNNVHFNSRFSDLLARIPPLLEGLHSLADWEFQPKSKELISL